MPKKRCRSGCLTCRIRRIKCDEGKPSCLRCTSTGRKCDGYESEPARLGTSKYRRHSAALRNTISPTLGSHVPAYEARALQHFQTRTAPALSASFDSDFWNTVVLQVSVTQGPVRSAVVAFSCLHESFEQSRRNADRMDHVNGSQVAALQHYNKAVHQTAQMLNLRDATSCRVALVSCLLFVCLELIQDNYTISINHLIGGLRMLLYCQNAGANIFSQPSLSLLHDNLKKFFGRIVVQTMFMADTHFDVRVVPKYPKANTQTPFASVTEARDMLDVIFLSVYPFLHLVKREPKHDMGKVYQHSLLTSLQEWHHLFRQFEIQTKDILTQKDITGLRLLEIHYSCLSIMINTSLDPAQCFSDPPSQSFSHVVTLVETLLEKQAKLPARLDHTSQSRLPYYSFDLGVIGPLFYVAVRCWHPLLRRKTVSMLQHPEIPHREGIWNASMTVTMAQRIIDVEEEVVQITDTVSGKTDEQLNTETLKKKVWFDFVRPKKDEKQLKIIVGTKREKPKERREEVITW